MKTNKSSNLLILLRLGEITIKSKRTRRRFENILVNNIKDALNYNNINDYKIYREWGRIYIETSDRRALEVLRRVFGIKSLSPVTCIKFTHLKDLVEQIKPLVVDKIRNKTFAVRARRVGEHDYTSMDIAKELGAALIEYSRGVDLNNPEVEVGVEVRWNRAYVYTEVIKGYGGLPIGTEGRVVSLVSGGFDSAVAAWYMLKRGAMVDYLLCNLGGLAHERGVLSVLKVLADKWSYGYRPVLYIVDFRPLVKEIMSKCNINLFNIILKRYMYRAAQRIAHSIGAEAIVTGESLGQVSSQTLTNLEVSSRAVEIQILRPLIGMDKDEIIERAREIGTYEPSSLVEEFCALFVRHPKTRASLKEVLEEEAKIDRSVFEDIMSKVKSIDLKSLSREDLLPADIKIVNIPEDAIVIDLRDKEEYEKWHYPEAINIPLTDLVKTVSKLGRDKTYVLYCRAGAESLEGALLLRSMGYKAFSLKGPIERVKCLARKSKVAS